MEEQSTTIQHLHLEGPDRYDLAQQKGFEQAALQNQYDHSSHANSHDITGTTGLVASQNEELEIKKVQFRLSNELYLRQHPELNDLMRIFMFKILEEKPQNTVAYAGQFFDRKGLKEIIQIEKEHYSCK